MKEAFDIDSLLASENEHLNELRNTPLTGISLPASAPTNVQLNDDDDDDDDNVDVEMDDNGENVESMMDDDDDDDAATAADKSSQIHPPETKEKKKFVLRLKSKTIKVVCQKKD